MIFFTSLTSRVILELSMNLSTIFTQAFSVCATEQQKTIFKLRLPLVQHSGSTVLYFSKFVCKTVTSKNRLAVEFMLHV
jgi:hypothetical protein